LTLLDQHHCHLSIESLSKQTYSTYRQLERKFSEQVGFAPKQYAKVVRFRKAYDQLMSQRQGNMIQIVADNNYYDQMHLIKDFKKFTSYTPKQTCRLLYQAMPKAYQKALLQQPFCNCWKEEN
jgi:AraC-like DNA-binding protein